MALKGLRARDWIEEHGHEQRRRADEHIALA
ncbi:hypothetical protein ENSA7_10940 [Enhygromyxa salina]|uniref:Uncharacterized protein n=1 Tax=Enhygromyxa salina TaxID=215803 RepID=A0A2S9YVK2_9BACT|nr:hypothetical protein ENSA7_10940 [Enhygromyxa salina]